MRDDDGMYGRTGFVNQATLAETIEAAIRSLDSWPEVEKVFYTIRDDSTDEPAIFFSIVLADEAVSKDRLLEVAHQVESALMDAIRPLENWGRTAYTSFRTSSEQKMLPDRAWS